MAFFSLTRRADYGLVMLVELARMGSDGLLSTRWLAEKKRLPRPFLANIGKALVEKQIIGSKEGKNGGYFLRRKPGEVKVVEVIEAIEGRVRPVVCVVEEGKCPVEAVCLHKDFMLGLTAEMEKLLGKYTLADLASPK